MVPMSMDLF